MTHDREPLKSISATPGDHRRGPRGRKTVKFQQGHYAAIAKIIYAVEDDVERKRICEVIGKGLNARSQVFDFYQWRKACNG